MTIDELYDALSAQAGNGQITLDTDLLSADEVTDIQAAFGLTSDTYLTITDLAAADVPQPADETITLAAGSLDLFGATSAALQVTFSVGDSGVALLLQCTMAEDWSLIQSFPALDLFPFNATTSPFASNLFVYTSQDVSAFTPAFESYADTTLALTAGW